jgi:hypothetical protein
MKPRLISSALIFASALLSANLVIPLVSNFAKSLDSLIGVWVGYDSSSRLLLDIGQALLGFLLIFLVLGMPLRLNRKTLLFLFQPGIPAPSNFVILSIVLGAISGIMVTVFVFLNLALSYRISSFLTTSLYSR